jgi:hypothetical protein
MFKWKQYYKSSVELWLLINMGGICNDVEAVEALHAAPGRALWSHVYMNESYYRIEFCTLFLSNIAFNLRLWT